MTGPSLLLASLCVASATAQLRIGEVLPDPVGPNIGSQIVEIHNVSGASFTPPGNWVVCIRRGGPVLGYPLMPSIAIPPGGVVQVHVGATGTDTATDWFMPHLPFLLADDEFAIYSTDQVLLFADPAFMLDFVSWGAGPGAFSSRIVTAVAAGLWPNTTTHLPIPAEGNTLAWLQQGSGPSAWYEDSTPTLGALNAPAQFVTFGTGCAGSAGVPDLHAATAGDLPWLGASFTTEVSGLPGFTATIMIMGLTETPGLPLASFGMPGCLGYLTVDTTFFGVGAGTVQFSIALPATASLAGITYVNQGVVLDPAAGNGLGAVVSNPARATTGLR